MASTARLDELKKKFDENPRRYFAPLANEHRKSGDLDQAIALCRAHLPQQPAHISGHIVLAQALFEAGSLDEAREIFHTALGLDPENLIALRYLGDIARDADDIDTARSWYQRVLEVDPRNDEIVQIVRDLDLPRDEVSSVAESVPAPVSSLPLAAPRMASAPAPAANDARFDPIPIESLELDESLDLPPGVAAADVSSTSSHTSAAESVDHVADAPTIELPALDTADIDPFDLDPAASAEALFDASAQTPATEDIFSDLSGAGHEASSQFDAADPSASDPWVSMEPEAESSTPQRELVDDNTTIGAAAFEEGSFYLEAPVTEASADSAPLDDAAFELPEAPAPVPVAAEHLDAGVPVAAEAESDSIAPAGSHFESSAHAEDLAERPTEEWQTPEPPAVVAASGNNDLGLEVMEFVPPSSDQSSVASIATTDADPLLGWTPELASASQGATPSSFVTETMAELYLQQGFRNEALAVYRELLARNPSDASLRERVEQVESGSMSSLGMANVSETVVESALKRQSARPAKSVRSFFASLAGRRAPAASAHEPAEPTDVDESSDASASHAAYPADEGLSRDELAPSSDAFEQAVQEQAAPMMSAAETLASFDPFADTTEPAVDEPQGSAGDAVFGMEGFAAPNADPIASESVPPIQSMASPPVEPLAVRPPEHHPPTQSAERTLGDLFPDTPVTARTEVAAQTLATAFGRTEPQGRPTRAANSELSLDKVFRGAPEGAPPGDGGFSFDQFFSDARPSMGGDVAAPAVSPPETGRSSAAASDSHDIEQFTAWLEGLKKK